MAKMQSLAILTLFGLAAAKQCTNITIPVDISAKNFMYSVPVFTSNQDAATFTQNYTNAKYGGKYPMAALLGYQTVEGSYNISAKFCTPDVMNGSQPVIQVLTHGIGFDKTYWDLAFNNFNYSYVDVLVDSYGFCTLSYDRFGIGNSSHGDPYTLIQAPAEVSALHQINAGLRNGTVHGIPHAFDRIVNVGHSFGSQQSYMLATMYPDSTDAIILTGFSFNGSALAATLSSWNSKIARENQPLRFGNTTFEEVEAVFDSIGINLEKFSAAASNLSISSSEARDILRTTELWDFIAGYNETGAAAPQDLPTGYITWADVWANQYAFLYPSNIDPEILYYSEQQKQHYTVGEILSLGGTPEVSSFSGPVQIVTGNQDAIYCSGDCMATGLPNVSSIPAAAGKYFPNAKPFSAYLQPNTGHAINLHYNATAAYKEISEFLVANGFKPS
ncbi:uncharacterized protein BDZ99DRAFT_520255 [Mytilinidion resinicola]|uniref:AB hydrolase-1 domain-containing protein n=1 Tax=Mytilinidion resinicola TaxID=574789 RepID=A0A6A6YNN1_9PEZI|nr:uncharacterized protein BDZ99DRAFT_520255 [Mytilinidion resinicola]KAF2810169.1 hypothetical protein BDZ99DRAFT_520255 [Mytilinidion resinicola]